MTWKKGESGNPGGRPLGKNTITHFIDEILNKEAKEYPGKTYKQILAEAYVRSAISGNQTAMKIVIQYIDGLPVQRIEQEGFMLNNLKDILRLKEYDPDDSGDNTEAEEGGGDMAE